MKKLIRKSRTIKRGMLLLLRCFLCLNLIASGSIFAGEAAAEGSWNELDFSNWGQVIQSNADEYDDEGEGIAFIVNKGGTQGGSVDFCDTLNCAVPDPTSYAQMEILPYSVNVQTALSVTGATSLSATTIGSTLNVSDQAFFHSGIGSQLNMNNNGIAATGAISGVTTIGASGQITSGSVSTGAISASSLNAGSGTIQTTGTVSGTTATFTNLSATTLLGAISGNGQNITGLNTLSATGLATLSGGITSDNFSVADGTGNTAIGGTLAVNGLITGTGGATITGATNINATGGATTNIATATAATTNIGVAGGTNNLAGTTNVTGATNINTSGTATTTIGNTTSTVSILGGTNTIGNAGTSANTVTGATNAITAASTNTISAGTNNIMNATQQNQLTGGTGNSIIATTGNNIITATTGSNIMTGTSNTVQAGTNKIVVAAPSTGTGVLISGSTTGTVSTSAGRLVGAVSITGSGGGANLTQAEVTTFVGNGLADKHIVDMEYSATTKIVTDTSTGATYNTSTGIGNWADVAIMSNSGTAGIRINDYGVQIISPPVTGNQVATNDIGTSTGDGTINNIIGGGGISGGKVNNTIGQGGTGGGTVTNSIGDGGSTSTIVNNTFGTGSSDSHGTVTNTIGAAVAGGGSVTNNIGTGAGVSTTNIGNSTLGTTNTITGGSGNSVTATTGNNAISATAGSNTISANAADQSNTISATGTSGKNNMTANSTTGTNNIEAKTNNIGVATPSSINIIGNAGTSTNTMTGNTNSMTSSTSNTISTNGGGSMQTTTTSVMMRGTNGLGPATNGTVGTTSHIGAGAITVTNSAQTIAPNTTIANALEGKQYQNKVNGNLYVDGNTYINGTLDYVSSNSATTTVVGAGTGTSILPGATQGTSGGTNIVMKGSNGATESKAELTLTNGIGNTHGVEVYENRTVLSGGEHSSNMRLDDSGATFYNSATNAPIKVTGVADGTTDFDAVNFRQLQKANMGIAAVSALAAIPGTMPGKIFAIGAGYGYFENESAVAIGVKALLGSRISVTVGGGMSVGRGASSSSTITANGGFSYSF